MSDSDLISAEEAYDRTSKNDFVNSYARLRQGLRSALWRNGFWPNNMGVNDDEIVDAVNRLMTAYEQVKQQDDI